MSNGKQKNQSLLNPVIYIIRKLTEDPIPFLFFGALIGLKIYNLITKIDVLTIFIKIMYDIDHSLNGLKALLFSGPVLDFIYTIAVILFDAVIIFSYLIRLKPAEGRGKAQGFRERWYPIITVLLPMVVFTYMLYWPLKPENDPLFHHLYQSQSFIYSVSMAGLLFSLLGCILSILALLKLKGSFSLMVEVRQLVTTGMYKYMRHPLYFSELVHALGTTLLLLNSITIPVYLTFLTLEVIRAKFEEKKFIEVIPEYAAYKARTGFLFPKFRHTLKSKEIIAQKSYEIS